MGGAWSCCLPCAGGGGGGAAVSGATPEAKKGSALLKHQQYQQPYQQKKGQLHEHQQQSRGQLEQQQRQQQQHHQQQYQQYQQPKRICVAHVKERAPLSDLDEDLDDFDDEKEIELRTEEEDYAKEGGAQHRLSPRLHDIEEEDDEEGRNIRERSVALRVCVDPWLWGSSCLASSSLEARSDQAETRLSFLPLALLRRDDRCLFPPHVCGFPVEFLAEVHISLSVSARTSCDVFCDDARRRGASAFRLLSLFHHIVQYLSVSPAGGCKRVFAMRDVYEISLYDRVALYRMGIASLEFVE